MMIAATILMMMATAMMAAASSVAAMMMAVSSKMLICQLKQCWRTALFAIGMCIVIGVVAFPVQAENSANRKIMINLASRFLFVYDGDTRIGMFPIGPGKVSTPSPTGSFAIFSMVENPEWIDPKDEKKRVPSGENNPLGYRWMGFYDTYGIHGTNMPGSIGWYVSNGCIRMYEADAEQVFDWAELGTPVEIYYDRLAIDRAPDHTISYYIYPDGYGWQDVDVAYVNHALAGYGIADFASNADIAGKIAASDGEPTILGQDYVITVNGKKLSSKAFQQGPILYLSAEEISDATGLAVDWDPETKTLTTPVGQAQGFIRKSHVYFNAADGLVLFYLKGNLSDELVYAMDSDWRAGIQQAWDRGQLIPETIPVATFIGALWQLVFA